MSSFHLPPLTPHPSSGSLTHLPVPKAAGKGQGALPKAPRQHPRPGTPPQGLLSSLYCPYHPKGSPNLGSQPPWTFPRSMAPGPIRVSSEKVPEGSNREELQRLQTSPAGARERRRRSRTGVQSSLGCAVTHRSAPPHAPPPPHRREDTFRHSPGAFLGTGGSLRGSGALPLSGGALPALLRDSGALSTLRQDKGRLSGE